MANCRCKTGDFKLSSWVELFMYKKLFSNYRQRVSKRVRGHQSQTNVDMCFSQKRIQKLKYHTIKGSQLFKKTLVNVKYISQCMKTDLILANENVSSKYDSKG